MSADDDGDAAPCLSAESLAALREFLGDADLQRRVHAEVAQFSREAEQPDALTAQMAHPEYWNARYAAAADTADDQPHEWLTDFSKLQPHLERWLGIHKHGTTLM
jgi:hypothetical protein